MSATASHLGPQTMAAYEAIRRHWQEQGNAPTTRQLCRYLGLNSSSTIDYHLKALVGAGLIEPAGATTRRGYRPVIADPCPACAEMQERLREARDGWNETSDELTVSKKVVSQQRSRADAAEAKITRAIDALDVAVQDRCTGSKTVPCLEAWPGEMGEWCAPCCARVALTALSEEAPAWAPR